MSTSSEIDETTAESDSIMESSAASAGNIPDPSDFSQTDGVELEDIKYPDVGSEKYEPEQKKSDYYLPKISSPIEDANDGNYIVSDRKEGEIHGMLSVSLIVQVVCCYCFPCVGCFIGIVVFLIAQSQEAWSAEHLSRRNLKLLKWVFFCSLVNCCWCVFLIPSMFGGVQQSHN